MEKEKFFLHSVIKKSVLCFFLILLVFFVTKELRFQEKKSKERQYKLSEMIYESYIKADYSDKNFFYRDDKSSYKKTLKPTTKEVLETGNFFYETNSDDSISIEWHIMNEGEIIIDNFIKQ